MNFELKKKPKKEFSSQKTEKSNELKNETTASFSLKTEDFLSESVSLKKEKETVEVKSGQKSIKRVPSSNVPDEKLLQYYRGDNQFDKLEIVIIIQNSPSLG